MKTETITVTISKDFAKKLRKMSYLLGDADLGDVLEEGSSLYDDALEDQELIFSESYCWENKADCEKAAKRIREHFVQFGQSYVTEPFESEYGWEIRVSHSKQSHAFWRRCHAEGLDHIPRYKVAKAEGKRELL